MPPGVMPRPGGQSEAPKHVFAKMFRPRPALLAGRALYERAVAQARLPVFYRSLGADDTPPGRFEVYSLHVVLILRRLKSHGPQAAETGQGLFDAFVEGLDVALRELGTGDLSMAKKMKTLGQAFYGRVKAYDEAFNALPDEDPIRDLLGRTVGEGALNALTAYVRQANDDLAAQDLADLLEGKVHFPEPSA